MEKPILIFSSITLLICLYFYSDFENKGFAYGIILLCLIAISFSYAKIKYPTESQNEYQEVEDENDKLENFDGIFDYKNDGFYIVENNGRDFIKWSEIIEVNSFSIPLLKRERQTGYEIITTNKNFEFNDETTPGIFKLGNKLAENLPDWKLDSPTLRVNNYGLEKKNLYKKENGIPSFY